MTLACTVEISLGHGNEPYAKGKEVAKPAQHEPQPDISTRKTFDGTGSELIDTDRSEDSKGLVEAIEISRRESKKATKEGESSTAGNTEQIS